MDGLATESNSLTETNRNWFPTRSENPLFSRVKIKLENLISLSKICIFGDVCHSIYDEEGNKPKLIFLIVYTYYGDGVSVYKVN